MQIHLIYRNAFSTRTYNIMKQFTTSMNYLFSISSLSSCFSTLVAVVVTILFFTVSKANAEDKHPGEVIFQTKCAMCHGQAGEGIAVFPPLAESEWVNGPEENLVRIQLRGLMGPITVKGKEYNGAMPPNNTMTDQEIADVLSFVRSHLGNSAPAISVDTVKKFRSEEGKPMLTVADLIDPSTAPAATVKEEETLSERTELEGFKPAKNNGSNGVIILTLGIIGLCTLPVLIGFMKN
jgi:mono/diheme cytochrome c family protein